MRIRIEQMIEFSNKLEDTVQSEFPSFDWIRTQYANPRTLPEHSVGIRKWRYGGDETYLTLARDWKAGESLALMTGQNEDLFILTLKIDNEVVFDQYDQEMTAKRIADGLRPGQIRPIRTETVPPARK